MVAIKYFLMAAASVASVVAQEPSTDAEYQALWDQARNPDTLVDAVDGTAVEKRSLVNARTETPAIMKDPYKDFYCGRAPYTKPAARTACTRNNCFRGFLNARDGSKGKVRHQTNSTLSEHD